MTSAAEFRDFLKGCCAQVRAVLEGDDGTLAAEIQAAGADLVALQEVEFEEDTPGGDPVLPAWIASIDGYTAGGSAALLPPSSL